MADHNDKTLTGDVELDASNFRNINFENARLIYAGGVAPYFDNCAFNGVSFEFQGPAHNTLNFLRSMAPEGTRMREVIYGLIPELKA